MDPPVSTGTSTVYPFGFADGCVALVQLLVLATKLRLELVAICEDWSLEIEAPWFAPELEMNPQGKDLLHFELVTCFSIFDFRFYELEQSKVESSLTFTRVSVRHRGSSSNRYWCHAYERLASTNRTNHVNLKSRVTNLT